MAKKGKIKEAQVIKALKSYFEKEYTKAKIDWNKMNISFLHNRGFPDLVILTPDGVFFLEVKAPGKFPTLLQRSKLISMQATGCPNIYWVDCDPNDVHNLYFRDPVDDSIVWGTDE